MLLPKVQALEKFITVPTLVEDSRLVRCHVCTECRLLENRGLPCLGLNRWGCLWYIYDLLLRRQESRERKRKSEIRSSLMFLLLRLFPRTKEMSPCQKLFGAKSAAFWFSIHFLWQTRDETSVSVRSIRAECVSSQAPDSQDKASARLITIRPIRVEQVTPQGFTFAPSVY